MSDSDNDTCSQCGADGECEHRMYEEEEKEERPINRITSQYVELSLNGKPKEESKSKKTKGGNGEEKKKKSKEPEKKPMLVSKYDPEMGDLIKKIGKDRRMVNVYEHLPEKYKGPEYRNPNPIVARHPCQIIVTGKTGSFKTNTIFNLICKAGCFDRLFICTKNPDEPLYLALRAGKGEKCAACDTIYDLPSIEEIGQKYPKDQILIVIDDMMCCTPKEVKLITEVYIRGRKGGGKHSAGISVCFISQDFHSINKKIRQNISMGIMTGTPDIKDRNVTLGKFNNDLDKKQFQEMYDAAVKRGPASKLIIDLEAPINERYKMDFDHAFRIMDENGEIGYKKENTTKIGKKKVKVVEEEYEPCSKCNKPYPCKHDYM